MQTGFQLAAVHGMLYTGGNVCFAPDGRQLYSPVNNYISSIQLQSEGHLSHTCSNSSIQCFDLSPDGDLMIAIGQRGLGFFYSVSARVVLDTVSFPPTCAVSVVRFSPCGKYIALALDNTLQVYTAPAKRVVNYHACHRIENLHSVLTMPIMNVEWTTDSEHLLVSGQDARIKIVPRQGKPQLKGSAVQQNALIGHRSAVLGAWFVDDDGARAVSIAADNVVIKWKRTPFARREVLQSIATANMETRVAAADADAEGEEDEGKVPMSFLERQRVERLKLDGVRVSTADDSGLPVVLRNAYEVDKKCMLSHKGNVSTAAFHKARGLVAIGYNSGIFAIHSLAPVEGGLAADDAAAAAAQDGSTSDKAKSGADDFPLVHLLSISAQALTTAAFSPNGSYVAFGSAHLKQLLVWDWTTEAYVLKEQAHYYDIARTAITADSSNIISGGEDGKVKVWKATSGQCFVTFTEHSGAITGLCTSAATNAFFTCSLDGTARGYDLVRYRAFRTFTAPEQTQFSCIAVDPSGDVLAVGSSRANKVYLFSVQTGRVVDILQGHEAPIACLAFHPTGTALTSGSMDHNIIVWDLFNQNEGGERLKGTGEVLDIGTEVLCVAYSSSGRRMAVLTAKQEISVYETSVPTEPELIKTFQTSFDAAGGWNKSVGPNSANYAANFTRIAFSPEGEKILAGGDSKWLVLYHASQGYVLRKWPITSNLDVLGAEEQYQWRNMTEAGFLGDIDIDDDDAQLAKRKLLEMPGSRHRHFATGKRKTEMAARCMDLTFASTGSEFVAATTDGLLVFSTRVARPRFQPLQLTANVTTAQAREKLDHGQPVLALMEALILGDRALGVECMRRLPQDAIPVAVTSTPSAAFVLLVQWVSEEVEASRGLEQALLWAQSLLLHASEALGSYAQDNSRLLPPLRTLQRALHQHRMLTQLAKENYCSLQYLVDVARMGKHGRDEITLKLEENDKEVATGGRSA